MKTVAFRKDSPGALPMALQPGPSSPAGCQLLSVAMAAHVTSTRCVPGTAQKALHVQPLKQPWDVGVFTIPTLQTRKLPYRES